MRRLDILVLSACVTALSMGVSGFVPRAQAFGGPSPEEAHAIAVDAYVYGYPLVTMEMTRRVMTDARADEGTQAPMGVFARMRSYPTPAFHEVTAPNADTLYTTAWVDLASGPYVLSIPDMHGRYFLVPMLDAWTEVFQDPGARTTGTGAQKILLAPAGWKGGTPSGVRRVDAPTNLVWIRGRIYSKYTPEDLDAVHRLEDMFSLVPLSAYGKPYTPPPGSVDPDVDTNRPVRAQVDALDAATFFGTMAGLMVQNPPTPADKDIVRRMAKIGLKPGEPLDASKLTPAVVAAIESAPAEARQRMLAEAKAAPMKENGWRVLLDTGRYGTDYLLRAMVAAVGLGANLPQDAVYPVAYEDADGRPLDGAHPYIIHMDTRLLPPAYGFWSFTLYDDRMFFCPNALDRHSLGQKDRLIANEDGTIDLLVQTTSPGADRESNWLPAPKGRFVLVLRIYWPTQRPPSILDGTWKPPPVRRVE